MGTVYNHTNLKFKVTIRSSSSSSTSSSSESISSSSSSNSISSSSSSESAVYADVQWSPSASHPSFLITSGGDLLTHTDPIFNVRKGFADRSHSTGKRYFEIKHDPAGNASAGVGVGGKAGSLTSNIGYEPDEWGYRAAASVSVLIHDSISNTTFGVTDWRTGIHTLGIAVDFDLGYIFFAVDGVQIKPTAAGAGGVSDPATGTWPCMTGVSGTLYPCSEIGYTNTSHFIRTEPDEFKYAVPSGFTPWGAD